MRFIATAIIAALLAGCVQPGTPIPEHRNRGLPRSFPVDFPLHALFSVEGTGKKLAWDEGDYFIVKFVTELKPQDIHYFFRKELATDRGYQMLSETADAVGSGFLAFGKGKRIVEITVGSEKGKNTILLRLKDKKSGAGR